MKTIKLMVFVAFIMLVFSAKVIAQSPNIDKIDDAVVLVLIYDYEGNKIGHGSGFFIDEKGTVVTNYHVVENAYSLKVKTDINGTKKVYDVDLIKKGSESKDLAIITIKNDESIVFPYLPLAEEYPSKGVDCWAIGTPARELYMNTVSKGLVSNISTSTNPVIIQTNAEITHGSSGGALINSKGEVIGITSAGDPTDDGARASINFAIWVGELSNLQIINKKSVIKPTEIPCKLAFYTNNPFSGDVYLYVNRVYIGNLTKYFPSNYTPNCGESGTITLNLYAGEYYYQVYYASINQWYYGKIVLEPGECKLFKITGVNYNITYNYPKPIFGKKKIDDRGDYKWLVGFGFPFYDGSIYGVQLTAERYFSDKFSIRGNLRLDDFVALGFDFKKIFPSDNRWNWYIAPSHVKIFDYGTWTGLRVGADRYTGKRFYLTSDFGLGYVDLFNPPGWLSVEMNFILGYRFNIK